MKQKLFLLLTLLIFFSQRTVNAQTGSNIASHVVISEVYGGGGNSGATYTSDFIELYNPTDSPISLVGYSVQYTSAAGTGNWAVTNLQGSIASKGFYLIQESTGAGGTISLPAPEVTGTIQMSGTAGKVALCSNTTALTGTSPITAAVVDMVGWGGANIFENASGTAAPAPVTTNITSIERKANTGSTAATMVSGGVDAANGNGYDSDNNSVDFFLRTEISAGVTGVNPQNSFSPKEPGAVVTTPTLSASPTAVDFGNLHVNLPSTEKTFVISCQNLTAAAVILETAAPYSISKTSGGTFGTSLTYTQAERTGTALTVYVKVIVTSTGPAAGSVTFSGGGVTAISQVSLAATGQTPAAKTLLSTINGSGATATAGNFTVEAIVTGVYGSLDPAGFYIQEEDADADANPNTSEGIFVSVTNPSVAIGDKVLVSGTVQENAASPSFNQAVIVSPAISKISVSNPAPAFTTISNSVYSIAVAEKYEGMLVQFDAPLTVSDVFSLGQYGELGLSMGGAIYTPTQIVDPNDASTSGTTSSGASNVAAVNALAAENANKVIVLDDGSGITPVTVPYLDPVLKTVRIGSTIAMLKGIMGYGFSKYRIQPLPGADMPVFSVSRPAAPTFPTLDAKLASFNVLNYFNGNGSGGGFPTSRGATTAAAFAIQRSKIIEAIAAINADAVGLMEIENDGVSPNSAIQDLINGLNAKMGANTYTFVDDGTSIQTDNTDQIRCAIIYKPGKLTPVGTAILLGGAPNRPSLIQTFTTVAENEKFNFIVNHFKSKGSGGTGDDANQLDGQGFYNATRKLQAAALASYIKNKLSGISGTDRVVSVGDYNAYYEEDPMDILRSEGLVVTSTSTETSYLFDGTIGSLDHAVVSASMTGNVSVKKWNVNSSEPTALQYTNTATTVASSPYRSSDHDPVIIGVDFSGALPVTLVSFEAKLVGENVEVKWSTAMELDNSYFLVERSANGSFFEEIAKVDGAGTQTELEMYQVTDHKPLNGLSYYRLKQTDIDGTSTVSRIVSVQRNAKNISFSIYPNPVANELQLKFEGDSFGTKELTYDILNPDGARLFKGRGTLSAINKEINSRIPSFQTGTYMIRLKTPEGSNHVFKFIKQ